MSSDARGAAPTERHPEPESSYTHQVRRVTWVGLAVNLLLAGLKFVGGALGASQAVLADAVHSLSDSTTDLAILIGVRFWSAPADRDHPHGHRRIETLITALIGLSLAAVAVGLTYNALTTLEQPHARPPGWIAFAAATASIAFKEALYRWTAAVGRRVRSTAVIANAWHHRSDGLSSVPAALAVAGARLYPAWSFLDHIGAIVVSLVILQAAWRIVWPALKELTDIGAPDEQREQIRGIALGTEGVEQVHAIRTRYVGSSLAVDLHVLVDGEMSVRQGHEISAEVKRRLLAQGPELVDVVVHLEPLDHP
jgi:cation diffusion facilitator family transporter